MQCRFLRRFSIDPLQSGQGSRLFGKPLPCLLSVVSSSRWSKGLWNMDVFHKKPAKMKA